MVESSICGRVGCAEPAVGALLIAPQDCQAWLVPVEHDAAPEGAALCETHADRITVPMGWSLQDDRRKKRKRRRAPAKARAPKTEPLDLDVAEAPDRGTTDLEPAPPAPPTKSSHPAAALDMDGHATVQLPAISIEPPRSDPAPVQRGRVAPSEVPLHADDVAAQLDDVPARLSVVPKDPGVEDFGVEKGGQGALWSHGDVVREATDETPLLKRAFRVIRDD